MSGIAAKIDRQVMRRYLTPGLATVFFAMLALMYAIDRPVYLAILNAVHVHPFPRPFLDTRFVTAQVECWQRGIDVYASNPCDPLGRTLDYSPLWLRLPFLARPDRWTPGFGLAIDGAFLFALFRMPWRPHGAFGVVVAGGAVVSWATMLAMERGNTDLLMFAVAVLFAHLAMRWAALRCAGYALVLCAGLLKFYPLTMLALVVREPRKRAWRAGALCALALVAFLLVFHAELSRIGANMANSPFGDMFGARSLAFGVPLRLGHAELRDASGRYIGPDALGPAMTLLGWILFAVMSGGCALAAIMCGRNQALRGMLDRIEPDARALLLVGGLLCAGCFFGHQNIGYRAVLLLLVLPGLLALVRVAPGGRPRLVFRSTSLLILLVLWDGILSRSTPGWFVMQVAWWWIVGVLLAILVSLLGGDVARVLGLEHRLHAGMLASGPSSPPPRSAS
nr:hypothetical protein [uncultured Lichenicoccus sp.]